MRLVGLTGGIGSGKTTALNCFREMGIPCFVSDIEAKKLYDDPIFANEIQNLMPVYIKNENGGIDKKKLADFVFGNKDYLHKLNSIVHPAVRKKFIDWSARILVEFPKTPYVIIESALIFQTGLDQILDDVIYVYLDKEERIERSMLRDNATREEIIARMNNQPSDDEAIMKSTYMIFNFEGNPLWKQVEIIDRCLRVSESKLDFKF